MATPKKKVTPTPIELSSGNTKPITVPVLDQDDAVVPITGATLVMVISKRPGQTALVTINGSVSDGPGGIASFSMAPADTASLRGVYYYEMKLTDVGGRVSTVAFGPCNILVDNA